MSGLFVTGTDTGVGQTVVSCALARGIRRSGIDVGVMKPVETGVPASGPADAEALVQAASVSDALDHVCPLQFELPAAPEAAALHAEQELRIDRIHSAYDELQLRHPFMLVKGAGGPLEPFDDKTCMADLAGCGRTPPVAWHAPF